MTKFTLPKLPVYGLEPRVYEGKVRNVAELVKFALRAKAVNAASAWRFLDRTGKAKQADTIERAVELELRRWGLRPTGETPELEPALEPKRRRGRPPKWP